MARPFVWTPAKEQAFQLEQDGRLTQAQIAARIGVTRRTIEGWARRPAWRARQQQRRDAWMQGFEARLRAHTAHLVAEVLADR